MKAEERHEMQTNSLAVFLLRLPEMIKEHSTKVLLVIALILLGIAAWNYRRSSEQNRQIAITNGLAEARMLVDELSREVPGQMPVDRVKTLPDRINRARTDLSQALDDVQNDPTRAAHAQVTLGDLYLHAASFQESVDQTKSLELAANSYNGVFTKFKDYPIQVRNAHLGLASLYTMRGDFKNAREQFDAIRNNPSATDGDKLLAEQGLAALRDSESPLLLLPATQPVVPASQPSAALIGPAGPVAPATAPTTAPATQPAQP